MAGDTPPHRKPADSFEDISERIDGVEEKLDKALRQIGSDPPEMRWIQRRIGRLTLDGARKAFLAACVALGAAAAGWMVRDCQATAERVHGPPASAP